MIFSMHHDDEASATGSSPTEANPLTSVEIVDEGDLLLIDEMLVRSPEERLSWLQETVRSLEALLAATGSTLPAE
jgi:hypothetical protein